MSLKVRRVPLDFDWLLDKVWDGYLTPDRFDENRCPDCKGGYSRRARHLFDLWYGRVPFSPHDTGSTPLRHDTPAVRAFAERNVAHAPEFYGTGEFAIVLEAERLARLWNGAWSHHLCQADVDVLVEAGRLKDFTHTWSREGGWQEVEPAVTPTAAQVNEWSLSGGGHDSSNAARVVEARCVREGVDRLCGTCGGDGSFEAYPGQRAEAEAWEWIQPPTGDGWQLWEIVSEGSPISPVFKSGEELAQWMTEPARESRRLELGVARRFVAAGWAPTFVGTPGGDLVSGEEWVGGLPERGPGPDDVAGDTDAGSYEAGVKPDPSIRPWIFKDHPANGDWTTQPWQWTIPACECDLDGGDLTNRTWSIVHRQALEHASRCPAVLAQPSSHRRRRGAT